MDPNQLFFWIEPILQQGFDGIKGHSTWNPWNRFFSQFGSWIQNISGNLPSCYLASEEIFGIQWKRETFSVLNVKEFIWNVLEYYHWWFSSTFEVLAGTGLNSFVEFFRIFELVADINSGVIFSLLPANSLVLGLSMYSMEHVNIHCILIIRNMFNISVFFLIFSVWIWSSCTHIWCTLFDLLVDLVIFVLLFCYHCCRPDFVHRVSCIWHQLVWLSR